MSSERKKLCYDCSYCLKEEREEAFRRQNGRQTAPTLLLLVTLRRVNQVRRGSPHQNHSI